MIFNNKEKEAVNCWFCGKEISEPSHYKVIMNRVLDKKEEWWSNTVRIRYERATPMIYRCVDCKMNHRKSKHIEYMAIILGGLTGTLMGLHYFGSVYWVAGMLAGILISWVIGAVSGAIYLKKHNIKSTRKISLKRHPRIRQLLDDKWQWNEIPLRGR